MENQSRFRWPWPLFTLALAVAGYQYYELYSSLGEPIAAAERR